MMHLQKTCPGTESKNKARSHQKGKMTSWGVPAWLSTICQPRMWIVLALLMLLPRHAHSDVTRRSRTRHLYLRSLWNGNARDVSAPVKSSGPLRFSPQRMNSVTFPRLPIYSVQAAASPVSAAKTRKRRKRSEVSFQPAEARIQWQAGERTAGEKREVAGQPGSTRAGRRRGSLPDTVAPPVPATRLLYSVKPRSPQVPARSHDVELSEMSVSRSLTLPTSSRAAILPSRHVRRYPRQSDDDDNDANDDGDDDDDDDTSNDDNDDNEDSNDLLSKGSAATGDADPVYTDDEIKQTELDMSMLERKRRQADPGPAHLKPVRDLGRHSAAGVKKMAKNTGRANATPYTRSARVRRKKRAARRPSLEDVDDDSSIPIIDINDSMITGGELDSVRDVEDVVATSGANNELESDVEREEEEARDAEEQEQKDFEEEEDEEDDIDMSVVGRGRRRRGSTGSSTSSGDASVSGDTVAETSGGGLKDSQSSADTDQSRDMTEESVSDTPGSDADSSEESASSENDSPELSADSGASDTDQNKDSLEDDGQSASPSSEADIAWRRRKSRSRKTKERPSHKKRDVDLPENTISVNVKEGGTKKAKITIKDKKDQDELPADLSSIDTNDDDETDEDNEEETLKEALTEMLEDMADNGADLLDTDDELIVRRKRSPQAAQPNPEVALQSPDITRHSLPGQNESKQSVTEKEQGVKLQETLLKDSQDFGSKHPKLGYKDTFSKKDSPSPSSTSQLSHNYAPVYNISSPRSLYIYKVAEIRPSMPVLLQKLYYAKNVSKVGAVALKNGSRMVSSILLLGNSTAPKFLKQTTRIHISTRPFKQRENPIVGFVPILKVLRQHQAAARRKMAEINAMLFSSITKNGPLFPLRMSLVSFRRPSQQQPVPRDSKGNNQNRTPKGRGGKTRERRSTLRLPVDQPVSGDRASEAALETEPASRFRVAGDTLSLAEDLADIEFENQADHALENMNSGLLEEPDSTFVSLAAPIPDTTTRLEKRSPANDSLQTAVRGILSKLRENIRRTRNIESDVIQALFLPHSLRPQQLDDDSQDDENDDFTSKREALPDVPDHDHDHGDDNDDNRRKRIVGDSESDEGGEENADDETENSRGKRSMVDDVATPEQTEIDVVQEERPDINTAIQNLFVDDDDDNDNGDNDDHDDDEEDDDGNGEDVKRKRRSVSERGDDVSRSRSARAGRQEGVTQDVPHDATGNTKTPASDMAGSGRHL